MKSFVTPACVVVACLVFGPRSADVVRGERFELVDADGNVRATLAFDGEGGEPRLVMLGREDGALLVLGLAAHEGQRRAGLHLEVDDPGGDGFSVADVDVHAGGACFSAGRSDEEHLSLQVHEEGSALVFTRGDEDPATLVEVSAGKDTPQIVGRRPSGERVFRLP